MNTFSRPIQRLDPGRPLSFSRLYHVLSALFAPVFLGAIAGTAPAHTDPACWDGPRIFHSGAPPADLANRLHLIQGPASVIPPGRETVAPAGRHRFWVRNPDTSKPGPWGAGVVVDTGQPQRPTLLIENVGAPIQPRWLNERLIFLRIMWGRAVFSDLIFDVESSTLRYHEQAQDGQTAYAQYRQACGGSCPCAAGDTDTPAGSERFTTDAPIPPATPAADGLIGLLELPTVFGPPEQGGVVAAADPRPLSAYAQAAESAPPFATLVAMENFEFREYAYEGAAAVVYRRRPGWFQIGVRLADRQRAWLRAADAGAFMPVSELLIGRLAYLNQHWDGHLWPEAAAGRRTGTPSRLKVPPAPGREQRHAVRILETRSVGDGLWLRVETLEEDECTRADAPVVDRGWIPAYAANGHLVAWYYSRGC